MREPIVLSGQQKQMINAAARDATTNGETLTAAVRAHLTGIVGHRNRRASNVELQRAIDSALSEL